MELECLDISFKYPGTSQYVFESLSFTITEPGFHALFGPSGVGKTSFAKIISGDLEGFSGELRTGRIQKIAYTYNLERLPGWASVGNHLNKIIPASQNNLKKELIDVFGLETCLNNRFSQLSMGQKNRINLLRYLLQDFHLLILDESLANVDEPTRETIILRIKSMFPQTFFLYISHNVVEVSRFCKKILVFRGAGKVPQSILVLGQDLQAGEKPDQKALEQTMLEIMNAS